MLGTTSTQHDLSRLREVASRQSGYFTTRQAAQAGCTTHLLRKGVKDGSIEHEQRGIYRLADFLDDVASDFAPAWLVTNGEGVLSHQTALMLYNICDILPARLHITLPPSWRNRGPRVLPHSVLYYAEIEDADRTLIGCVPITTYRRTLEDCAATHVLPDLLQQAAREAIDQGLVREDELVEVQRALRPFGGIWQ